HEGHSGYVIKNLGTGPATPYTPPFTPPGGVQDNLNAWMGPGGASPQFILLMVGTNDVAYHYFNETAPQRLDDLISAISDRSTGLRPDAHLIVAQITRTPTTPENDRFVAYKNAIPGVVANHQAKGERVTMVDMYDALSQAGDF